MTVEQLESNVLKNLKLEFSKLDDKDSINKLYRQARIWVRFQRVFGEAITAEDSWELNSKIKKYRWERLEQLGYKTVLGGLKNGKNTEK